MRVFYLVAAIVLALANAAWVLVDVQSGIQPDHDRLQAYQLTVCLMVVVWLLMERRLPGEHRPTLDYAFLLIVSFPVLAFYHQFLIRRWWGIATVCGLMLIQFLPYIAWISARSAADSS